MTAPPNNVKPGYKTTEAWVSMLSSVFIMFNLSPEDAAVAVGGISSIYTLGRSMVKTFQSRSK